MLNRLLQTGQAALAGEQLNRGPRLGQIDLHGKHPVFTRAGFHQPTGCPVDWSTTHLRHSPGHHKPARQPATVNPTAMNALTTRPIGHRLLSASR
jgi:hypothetical protein